MIRCFFFFNWGQQCCFFFGWILRRLRLHLVSELFLFFFNTIIRASKSSLSQKETLVVIGHLLSLVTRKKKSNLGMRQKVLFFPSIYSSSRVFFVCLAGSIYFVFFLFILLFFCVFLSNVKFVWEKKRNTHSNLESCFRLKKKFPKRNVVNDVIGWFSSFATMCYI